MLRAVYAHSLTKSRSEIEDVERMERSECHGYNKLHTAHFPPRPEHTGEPKDPAKHLISVCARGDIMKQPEYAPPTSDRVSTREELFEVLELLGGFEESQESEVTQTSDLLACLEAEAIVPATEALEEVQTGEERFLMEIESFDSLLATKAERIN